MKTMLALALSFAAGAIVVAQSPATDVGPAALVGSWQQTQHTNDRNGNRQIDPEELKAVTTAFTHLGSSLTASAERPVLRGVT